MVALARALSPQYRVVALDQRGHGESDKPGDLSWDAYISDLGVLLDHLAPRTPTILIGNSLGGTIAFRLAARHPAAVAALVIEESPAEETGDLDFMKAWDGNFPTREALRDAVGERLFWSVEPSVRQVGDAWTLVFPARKLVENQAKLNGSFRSEWLDSPHPALVVIGRQSRAVDGNLLREMVRRRPNTELAEFDAGHVVHLDAPEAFNAAVRAFLDEHSA